MKKLFTFLLAITSFMAYSQSTTVVISQVYGGGGSASGTYNADYVELHNVSNVDQDISGFKILYGSATGNLASTTTNAFTFPATGVIIPAGGYLLVAAAAGTGLAPLPVTPDQTFTLTISGTNGKVAFGTAAMVNNATLAAQPAGSVIDFIGYGSANEWETAACPALTSTNAAFRNANGCQDTNNNSSDFTLGSPNPRNSASPVAICGVTPLPPALTVSTVLPAFGNVCINTTAGPNTFVVGGSNLDATDITIAALTGYAFSLDAAGTYTSTLTIPQTGGTFTATVYVQFAPTVVQSYGGNIAVSGGGASAINVAASGYGVDAAVVYTNAASAVTPTSATLPGTVYAGCEPVTAYGMEYSTVSGFTPGTGTQVAGTNLTGSAFSVSLSGLPQSTTYYYVAYATTASGTVYGTTVQTFSTGFESTGGAGVVISQVYGGGGSATATYNADYVELHNNTLADQNISGCKLMYGSAAGNLGATTGNVYTFPVGTVIPSGGYLLVATVASTGLADLPLAADQIFTINMSGTNGKVAFGSSGLLTNSTLAAQPTGSVYDFIGYGTANEAETTAAPALSTTTAGFRNNNGCDDTNDNSADITAAAPLPRNSTSPVAVCSSLPVSLTRFDVKKAGDKVQISWATASEQALREFNVERSVDGLRWEVVATVLPRGGSQIIGSYDAVDARPLNGLNLYRLKSVNINGSKEYSSVKSVLISKSMALLTIPNPATDQVTIYMDKTTGTSAAVQLIDVSGKVIKQYNTNDTKLSINTAALSRGIYVIKVITNNKQYTNRVVLQ